MSVRWDKLREYVAQRVLELDGARTADGENEMRYVLERMTDLEKLCDHCGADESNSPRSCQCWNDE